MDATTVGVDLAKTVFELALANAQWRLTGRQRLNRAGLASPKTVAPNGSARWTGSVVAASRGDSQRC
jgi:hypothetical protein